MGWRMQHPGLSYSTLPGIPGEYFRCDKLAAEFTASSCARRWKGQQGKEHIGMTCYRCPIGASHANQVVTHSQYLKQECVRCHCLASRLVRGLICVSCFNRQQEVLKGQDRRGKPPKAYERMGEVEPKPKKLVRIHLFEVRYIPQGADKVETFRHQGADRQEAILAVLRQCQQPPMIVAAVPVESGEDLFGGFHRFTLGSRA